MAGSFNIFYMSQEPLYTKEELLAINDTIQNSNTTKPEPEKYGAVQADKKSKVSLILWLEIKRLYAFQLNLTKSEKEKTGYTSA